MLTSFKRKSSRFRGIVDHHCLKISERVYTVGSPLPTPILPLPLKNQRLLKLRFRLNYDY